MKIIIGHYQHDWDYFFKTLKDNKSITKSLTTKSINGYTD
jgi:hypothetical protein